MGKNTFSSELNHLLIVLLLLCTFLCSTESALPSHHGLLSISGRRMLGYYKPNGVIGTPSSTSDRGGGSNGRRLMDHIDIGKSISGQAGGRSSESQDSDSHIPH